MMPTSDDILLSMQQSVEAQDKGIDVRKGPFFDLLRPVAGEVAQPYDEIQKLSTLYSTMSDATTVSEQDLEAIGRNLRVPRPAGRKSSGLVYLFFTTKPSDSITIPAGTSVMTSDGSLVFSTKGSITLSPNTVQQYFVGKNSRYEVPVTVQATSEGSIYNLPAYRLNRLGRSIAGISGVYNPSPTIGGEDESDVQDYLSKIRNRFLGKVDSSTFSITSEIEEQYGYADVNYVQGDSRDFKRPIKGKGLDVVVRDVVEDYWEDLFVCSGALKFQLTHGPVLRVVSAQVDGQEVDFEYLDESTDDVRGSTKGIYNVVVPSATFKSNVRIRYVYCSYCWFIQTRVLNAKATGYFGLDALARLPTVKDLLVEVAISTSSSTSGLLATLKNEIFRYVSDNGSAILDPVQMRTQIMNDHPELRSFTVTTFTTKNKQGEVKVQESTGYELFQLNSENLNITFN